jgi:hypothetical protein
MVSEVLAPRGLVPGPAVISRTVVLRILCLSPRGRECKSNHPGLKALALFHGLVVGPAASCRPETSNHKKGHHETI